MIKRIISIILLNILFLTNLYSNTLQENIKPLTKSSFKTKQKVIENIVENNTDDKNLIYLLNTMLKGDLYFTKYKKQFVKLIKKDGKIYHTKDIFTKETLEPQKRNMFKKVKTNNKIRGIIRSKLAELNLFSDDKKTRLKSAKNILKNISESSTPLIKKALISEKETSIRDVLVESYTILQARFGTDKEKIKAITELGDYLSPQALQALIEIKSNSKDENIINLVSISIESIESSKSFYGVIETLFFGLSQGSVLLLAALGLAITFGVMKVINMAHGEMMMIGAYTTFTLQQVMPAFIEYSIIIAIPLAFLVSAMVGVTIERLVIRHLYGRPLETLLATFGISLILQQIVRTVYSPLNQEVKTPEWMSGAWEINSALSITFNRLYIVIFSILVFISVLLLLKKTSLGLKVRAVTQNREMAQAMGIKTGFIDAMTFGIGSGIAGVAGVALSQLTNVGPNLGQAYIVDSFMVVVFGGVGNLWGTLIAAMSLGEINKIIEPLAGAVLAKVIILVFIILFIQKRPRGLFPQKGRDAQD
ncbi:MAG TPA: urea ABC transporter permease subunit UrtB [Arcobacter sp.]|nr:urea ABC transporter permease subunit UrtB [Arcobacter sp.]